MNININELSKKSHKNAKLKGFYDCPECDGMEKIKSENNHTGLIPCPSCNGTGIDQNKNIPELLMLVITEISEAVEALRCGLFADWSDCLFSVNIDCEIQYLNIDFENHIKDTFEDEIADVFIRLFDLCGYLEIEIDEIESKNIRGFENNNSENLFNIVSMITELSNTFLIFENQDIELIKEIFNQLLYFCEHNNIDIEKHITSKMQYNKTRPKKHGKEF